MTQRQNLTIYAGQTWSWAFEHSVDLTAYTARMSIRREFGGAVQAYLSTDSDADGGTIVLSGTTVTLSMTAVESASLITDSDLETLIAGKEQEQYEEFIFDVEILTGTTVTRILEGQAIVHRNVTT